MKKDYTTILKNLAQNIYQKICNSTLAKFYLLALGLGGGAVIL